jgi:hypothetical protein
MKRSGNGKRKCLMNLFRRLRCAVPVLVRYRHFHPGKAAREREGLVDGDPCLKHAGKSQAQAAQPLREGFDQRDMDGRQILRRLRDPAIVDRVAYALDTAGDKAQFDRDDERLPPPDLVGVDANVRGQGRSRTITFTPPIRQARKTTVRAPFRNTRPCKWCCTAVASTRRSMSRPLRTRSSGVSPWLMASTS